MVEPGRRCPAIPATLNQVGGGGPVGPGQGAARGHQAGDRAGQPVRISSQGGVGLLQPVAGGVQLVALQVHKCEGYRCRGPGLAGLGVPRRIDRGCGQVGSAAQSAAQCLDQGELSVTGRPLAAVFREGSCRTGEGHGRWTRIAGPELDGTAARQYLPLSLRVAAPQAGRKLLEQGLRLGGSRPGRVKIPAPASRREAEHRGGQPGGDLVTSGEAVEAFPCRSEQAAGFLVTAVT